jgi:hypothetical protein
MVLEGLEDEARSLLAEEGHVQRGTLTIEHVLPQKWQEHWPLPEGDELEAVHHRERLLHSLGNLTLVNGRLNPTLSNGPWGTKQALLAEHSVLHLNKELLLAYADRDWDEQTIRERARALALRAKAVWPGPDAFVEDVEALRSAQSARESISTSEESTAAPSVGKWDEDLFFARLAEECEANDVAAMRRVFDWSRDQFTRLSWGAGNIHGSVYPVVDARGVSYWAYSLWTSGEVEIAFYRMLARPPFDDADVRDELRVGLKRIDGVDIAESSLDKLPNFPISALRDDRNSELFFESVNWFIETAKNFESEHDMVSSAEADVPREAIREALIGGATPDQIYERHGRRNVVWLVALEEEAGLAGELAAFEATPDAVVSLRDQRGLRWERIAVRVYGDARKTEAVKRLYDEVHGQGAARRSYTGRGRRYPEMF